MTAPTLISDLFGRLGEVDGIVLTDPFADPAFLLFEVEAAFVDVGDERDRLGEVNVDRLVRRYLLVELVGVLDRAVFDARRTPRTLLLDDVAGLSRECYGEVARLALYTVDFGIGEDLDVRMPADLDQLGCEYSHGAVVRREGLVELGHMAPDARRFLDEVDLEAGVRTIERGLDAADASAHHHHVAEGAVREHPRELPDILFEKQDVFHGAISPQQIFNPQLMGFSTPSASIS